MKDRLIVARTASVRQAPWQPWPMMKSVVLLSLLLILLVGCSGAPNASTAPDEGALAGNSLRPVEEEQIQNVVADYFVRDSGVPSYEVVIEQVTEHWARVAISPVDTENSAPNLVYLQDQSATEIEAPTADANANPGNIAPVDTTSGWTIIIGPQVNFTDEELDAAGVPLTIRK